MSRVLADHPIWTTSDHAVPQAGREPRRPPGHPSQRRVTSTLPRPGMWHRCRQQAPGLWHAWIARQVHARSIRMPEP